MPPRVHRLWLSGAWLPARLATWVDVGTHDRGHTLQRREPTEGTAFVLLDDRAIALDFDKWLADLLKAEQRIVGSKPRIEHVNLAGGPAIKDATNMFGSGRPPDITFPLPARASLRLPSNCWMAPNRSSGTK
jgi:hypothetical protein